MTKKTDKVSDEQLQQHIAELTNDLQRTRADFENYRRRVESDLTSAKMTGEQTTVAKILPILDDIDRATAHIPADITETDFAKGIVNLTKNLVKTEGDIGLVKIDAKTGTAFNPDLHHAVSMDDSEGEHEIVQEELRSGWLLNGAVLRPAMVSVTRQ